MTARAKSVLILVSAIAVTAIVSSVATRYGLERSTPGLRHGSFESKSLGEDRTFLVYLPDSYTDPDAADRRYPVIYALDGSSQADHTHSSAAMMARLGLMPEVIVVGIPNVSREGRARDYTPPEMREDPDDAGSPLGKADRFLAFLRDELIPHVERHYRTAPSRLLTGHSRGGLFVVYSLIAAPGLFDARFAYSAPVWRQDALLVQRLEAALPAAPPLRGELFVSVGERETDRMKAGFERLVGALEKHAPASLRWRAELTPRADHGNNSPRSTPAGLRHAFAQWAPAPVLRLARGNYS